MIWIEHDMQMVVDLADRIHVLDYGRTLVVGTPEKVFLIPKSSLRILDGRRRLDDQRRLVAGSHGRGGSCAKRSRSNPSAH